MFDASRVDVVTAALSDGSAVYDQRPAKRCNRVTAQDCTGFMSLGGILAGQHWTARLCATLRWRNSLQAQGEE